MIFNFFNFREINCGKISPQLLYRSSHPVYDGKQDEDIILAVSSAKIQTIINLSDNTGSLKQKIICCPWYKKLFEKNNAIALNIGRPFDILDAGFLKKIKDGLLFMTRHEAPYLIHCEAGMDRTGFLSMLLEAFMGAGFDDLVKDYMLSFADDSEYSLNDYKNGSKFIVNIFSRMKGELIDAHENLQPLSAAYLAEKIKLSGDELQMLENRLMGR